MTPFAMRSAVDQDVDFVEAALAFPNFAQRDRLQDAAEPPEQSSSRGRRDRRGRSPVRRSHTASIDKRERGARQEAGVSPPVFISSSPGSDVSLDYELFDFEEDNNAGEGSSSLSKALAAFDISADSKGAASDSDDDDSDTTSSSTQTEVADDCPTCRLTGGHHTPAPKPSVSPTSQSRDLDMVWNEEDGSTDSTLFKPGNQFLFRSNKAFSLPSLLTSTTDKKVQTSPRSPSSPGMRASTGSIVPAGHAGDADVLVRYAAGSRARQLERKRGSVVLPPTPKPSTVIVAGPRRATISQPSPKSPTVLQTGALATHASVYAADDHLNASDDEAAERVRRRWSLQEYHRK